jgi:multiple sugar transport system substrate-binding protein
MNIRKIMAETEVGRMLKSSMGAALFVTVGLASAAPALSQEQEIQFWTQPYGDLLKWKEAMNTTVDDFYKETGIKVNLETINWSTAFKNWLTVAQGGAAPDCGDMFWLYSFAGIGGDQAGPKPITKYLDEWPTLKQDFYPSSLADVYWKGDFYGIPWRIDIRPQLYSKKAFQEAGLSKPPESWDDIVTYAQALTKRDDKGNVIRWGYAFGDIATLAMVPLYWQAGGSFMSEDGKIATIDNPEMRQTLEWMRDMVWKHKIVSPEFMEPSFDTKADFISGKVAIVGSIPTHWPKTLDSDYPELADTWALALPPKGSKERLAYSGAGYWGVLRGSKKEDSCIKFIKYLSGDERMLRLSIASGNASPRKSVMKADYWQDREWKKILAETMEYGQTSQHPSSVWNSLVSSKPGGVIYDMMYDAIVLQKNIDTVVVRAQKQMQTQMDRVAN